MEIFISSFLGFMLGILSTFVIEKINELRRIYSAITQLAFEFASNQELIDLLREVDLEKSVKEDVFFAPPTNEIYLYVKDELQLLPPHILQYITRYYLLIDKHKLDWQKKLKTRTYRKNELTHFLNTLENYSVSIMLNSFRPIIEARNPLTRFYYIRRLLLSPTWLQKGKDRLDWKRYEVLQEEIYLNKNQREGWESFVSKYNKTPPKSKE